MSQLAELISPLGKDLLFHEMSGTEEMSRPSAFSISMLSDKPDIDFKKLLGKHLTIKMTTPEGSGEGGYRYFDSIVESMQYGGMRGRYHLYLAQTRSWLHFLNRTRDFRIFQDETVIEIVKKIFAKHGISKFDFRTTATYTPWWYCTQYKESDLDFVNRLLQLEGIGYYFTHKAGEHTLVLTDSPVGHKPFAGYEEIFFQGQMQEDRASRECIRDWGLVQTVQSGKYVITDYDFERPSVSLIQQRAEAQAHELAHAEVFDYPGEYVKEADGEQFVRSHMEEHFAATVQATGDTDARGMACGHAFALKGFIRQEQNIEYLVRKTNLHLMQADYEGLGGDQGGAFFGCNFEAQDAKVQYRPPRVAPKPVVQGPQTAVVVGPAGDEIMTDQYGRVKVHFHWDRYGKKDGTDSCWVRVASVWAGKNFGFVHVPRIGQEVIVDFLNGDPNEPMITGRVYNAEQMPPWELPGNATQSGMLSRSSKGGVYSNANAIRFEDKKGEEQLWFRAEKDQLTEVEHDEDKWVGNDRRKTIDGNETTVVHKNRTETVDQNETITVHQNRTEVVDLDETITIHKNRKERVDLDEKISIGLNRSEDVGVDETIRIGANRTENVGGNQSETVAMADMQNVGLAKMLNVGLGYSINVGAAMNTLVGGFKMEQVGLYKSVTVMGGDYSTSVPSGTKKISAGKDIDLIATDEIRLTVGKSTLVMKKDGTINLNGKDISVGASSEIDMEAKADITMRGKNIKQNG
jgi:type VI secretion system secreted protein VgrG